MSEENKTPDKPEQPKPERRKPPAGQAQSPPPPAPGQYGPPPPGQFGPPPPQQRPTIQMADVRQQIEGVLDRLGIDLNIAVKVLIVAVVAGIVAGLLDEIIGLPLGGLAFTFGWIITALVGPTYAFFKGEDDLAGVVMAAVSGLVVFVVYYLLVEIIGTDEFKRTDSTMEVVFKAWFNKLNVLKAGLTGIIIGLLSFGWFAGMRRLPKKFLP